MTPDLMKSSDVSDELCRVLNISPHAILKLVIVLEKQQPVLVEVERYATKPEESK